MLIFLLSDSFHHPSLDRRFQVSEYGPPRCVLDGTSGVNSNGLDGGAGLEHRIALNIDRELRGETSLCVQAVARWRQKPLGDSTPHNGEVQVHSKNRRLHHLRAFFGAQLCAIVGPPSCCAVVTHVCLQGEPETHAEGPMTRLKSCRGIVVHPECRRVNC